MGNFHGCLTVKSDGLKGRLCLMWVEKVDLRVNSYSSNHIDSKIYREDKKWRFTRISGHLEGHKKVLTKTPVTTTQ